VFDHVTIRVSDRPASVGFYDTVLRTLGIEQTGADERYTEWNDFSLAMAGPDESVTSGLHIAYMAPTRGHVDEFWRVGTGAGFRDDGPPGWRPQYREDYYGSFLLDPDGNSVEAVHHGAMRGGGIDHLWIRVSDVSAAKRFYEIVAPLAGFRLKRDSPDRAQFVGASGSFSLVEGTPTQPFHMAFPTDESSVVDAFHRATTAAGYRDNGAPGERPVYHNGYYGAFVLDPDGHNVEVVNHNR
jgi:catechol 2,3-dioxygenase-like lactoylglutathione lyase family enzyme